MLDSQDSTVHTYVVSYWCTLTGHKTSHQDERKQVYLDSNTSTIGSLERNLKFLRVQAAESLWLLTKSPYLH